MYLLLWLPAVVALWLAPRFGRNRYKWAAICLCTSFFGLIAMAVLPNRKYSNLEDYLRAHPECKTSRGISCAHCGSGSIRLWRQKEFLTVRHYHLCNH